MAASSSSSPTPAARGSTSTRTTSRRSPGSIPAADARGDLRRLSAEIVGQLRQLLRFGTPAQLDRTRDILSRTRGELYEVLANPPDDATPEE